MYKQLTVYATGILLLLSGCFCKRYYSGYSSVRFLRGQHVRMLCYDPHGIKDGKKVLVTAYTADPYFQHLQLNKQYKMPGITSRGHTLAGLRAETYWMLGTYPCPLLGIGPDYSYTKFNASCADGQPGPGWQQYELEQHRGNLHISLVTWIRPRMMGYASIQPGYQLARTTLISALAFSKTANGFKGGFNWRVAYGFQFYLAPPLEVNIEFGYGAGAFIRGGVGVWVF